MGVKPHVIMFLDILGYKNMITSVTDENDYLGSVHTLMSLLSKYIETYNQGVDEKTKHRLNLSRFKSMIFSDNILFFAPYDSEIDMLNLANNLIYGLSQFLFQYTKSNIFFRGAITAGQLFYDEKLHFVFGTGLVRAYELESNIAIYPRIVIDTCLKPSPILVGWAQDEDGIWYADYLTLGYALLCNPHNGETPIPHDEFLSYIVSHKNGICSALEKYKTNDRVYIKYRWLASYHNRFCRHTELSDLIIDIGRQ